MVRRLALDIGVMALAALAAVAVRLLAFGLYTIPSESMLPTLMGGDYLLVAKWAYGWTGDAGPLLPRLWRGRLRARPPRRGDVVVFAAPGAATAYVKRVIGLPGDRVALRRGTVLLNGRPLARQPLRDLMMVDSPASPCRPEPGTTVSRARYRGRPACRYHRYREVLPDGRAYAVLDLGRSAEDDFAPTTVPAGRLFLLGDDRDRSADSRLPAGGPEGGVGMVPMAALIGRALLVVVSVDGTARLDAPRTWLDAIRRRRLLLPVRTAPL